jgi:hypothetical protein
MRGRLVGVALIGFSGVAQAQDVPRAVVRVQDDSGRPVPWAVVSLAGGVRAIADSAGQVPVLVDARDSLGVEARRIGYRPYFGWSRRGSDGAYVVTMTRVVRALDTVRVVAQRETPLARSGFYDRAERAKKGLFNAEFITPEELDARNLGRLSDIFQGRRTTRIARTGGVRSQPILLGRGGCSMTVVVDGMRVTNTMQDSIVTGGAPQSIFPGGSRAPGSGGLRIGLDDIVDGRSVMGIEIYPSSANAPAELIPIGGRGSCGFVAIWTGPRY